MSGYIYDLKRGPAYLKKSFSRQEELDWTLGIVEKVFGPQPMAAVTALQVEKFYTALEEKRGVDLSARVMKDLRFLFNRAIKQRVVTYNPALAVEVTQPTPRKVVWRPEQVKQAIQVGWDDGLRGAAVALAIAYDTGLSSADIRSLTVGDVANGPWSGKRVKTGQAFHVDLSPDVLMLLRRYHDDLGVIPTPESVAVRTRRGKPFKKERLSRNGNGRGWSHRE